MKKHKAAYYSPGTFLSEESWRDIDAWDIKQAVSVAGSIAERYDAKPFGFRFLTLMAHEPVPDGEGGTLHVRSKEIARSGIHFITGHVLWLDDLVEADNPRHAILISNMKSYDYPLVIVNTNSWKVVQPFDEDALLVDWDGTILDRGDRQDYVRYRAEKKMEHEAELAAWSEGRMVGSKS